MVNYDKSTIYKLCCKDPEVTEIYVGSTTNFRRRKAAHKSTCNNENNQGYNTRVYVFIRENGGFSNWDMIEVEKYCATDRKDLLKRERYWFEELKASLNKDIPSRTLKEYRTENKEMITQKNKIYREENREKISQRMKKYYEENKERINERDREYYKENKEISRKYYKENKVEIAQKNKVYREKNKVEIAQKNKGWREENKESLAQKAKIYREKNKEKISQRKKVYHKENREKNVQKMREKITCDCGSVVRKSGIVRHKKTAKHQKWVEANTDG